MRNCSKPAIVVRTCSLLLILSVPYRYLAGILPAPILPLWGLCCTAAIHLLYKKGIRAEAAWLFGIAAALIVPAGALGLSALIPHISADTLFLRIKLITGLLALTACITVTAAVMFLYTERWRRYEPLAAIIIFALLFFPQQHYRLTVFSNPLFAASFTGVFMLLQIILLAIPLLQRRRFIAFLLIFICLATVLLMFLTSLFNKGSIGNNGGLLEQKLFEFDFSQFLKLQDEVHMNTHLVMIVHIDQEYDGHLFRRMYLSGWSPNKGFYEKPAPGETAQQLTIPQTPAELPHQRFQCRETVSQEIFAINLDSSSLIALDYPLSVTPYTVWDTVSFKGAYKAESEILHGVPLDLITAAPPSGNAEEGLSEEALRFYTAIDAETKALLLPIAQAATDNLPLYYDKVYALLDYFREGEYRYSLRPGQAPDGDQLRYFITEAKKGYCSYFAFAYCLMLRSLGIPARLAAGFFLQPESGILNYYPVRANMAHAWVEVFFPYLGWVEMDPTTAQLAEDDTFDFSFQAGGDQFTQLLDEIVSNRSLLRIRNDELRSKTTVKTVMQRLSSFFKTHQTLFAAFAVLPVLLLFFVFHIHLYLIIRFSRNRRKIILTLKRLHKHPSKAFYALTQKAKFAPSCTDADVKTAKQLYRSEKKQRKKEALHTDKHGNQCDTAKHQSQHDTPSNSLGKMLVLLFFFLLPLALFPASGAEVLLQNAEKAIQAENWDNAVRLLEEGITQYPANELFQLKLGDMYFNNGLYEPAYRRFIEGLQINRYNIKLLYGASNAAAALNKEEEARRFLHEYLSYNPTDIFGWSSYGWLCFKTHRTEEGIQAMLDARNNYGDDGCLANALGNLYGELFDYPNAASYYRKGIELALQNNSLYSASVYSYNKAILETEFYHFDQAEEDARKASDFWERSSGYLILGELEERKNNFERAINYYVRSMEYNRTPLPLINLAKIYLRMGQLEQAERYIAHIERITDDSWIANFGMSTTQFYAKRHSLYRTLYEKKYAAEKMKVPEGIKDFFIRRKNLLRYGVLVKYYRAAFSISSLKSAKEYRIQGNGSNSHELYKNRFYYDAFASVPFKALRYLHRAEELETSVIPAIQASYTAEKGILLRDTQLLAKALQILDPIWERETIEQATAVFIGCTRNTKVRAELYKELLHSNPACFPEHWIRLPVTVICTASDERLKKRTEKRLIAALKKSLFTVSADAPFSLTAVCSENDLRISLIGTDGTVYLRYNHSVPVSDKTAAAACVNRIASRLFKARQ